MFEIEKKIIQKGLYIVSTPIGNLKDITIRALIVLKNCDFIACEDTRVTKKLLSHYKIKSKLISCHEYTPENKLIFLIDKIKEGKSVAIVSDAGTPLISDPGFKLVLMAIKYNLSIIPIPGPSAVTASLVISGLQSEKFFFVGFLPSKENKRLTLLKNLNIIQSVLIFFESPKRLKKTLKNMFDIFGNRKCVISREITKYYESFYRGELKNISEKITNDNAKGEFTIVLDKSADIKNSKIPSFEEEKLKEIFLFSNGKISTKNLSNLLSIIYKKPKKYFYSQAIKFNK